MKICSELWQEKIKVLYVRELYECVHARECPVLVCVHISYVYAHSRVSVGACSCTYVCMLVLVYAHLYEKLCVCR